LKRELVSRSWRSIRITKKEERGGNPFALKKVFLRLDAVDFATHTSGSM